MTREFLKDRSDDSFLCGEFVGVRCRQGGGVDQHYSV